jgi:hypothetical protein
MLSRTVGSNNYPIKFFLIDENDHITGLTGLTNTPVVYIDKNGVGFGAAAGGVTELSYGWYQWVPDADDRDTKGELSIHIVGTGADPCDFSVEIVEKDLDTIGSLCADLETTIGTPTDTDVSTDIANMATVIDDIHDTDLPAIKTETAAILLDTGTTLDGVIDDIHDVDLPAVKGVVDAIKIITDYLSAMLEVDGLVRRFTANALEQAPSSGGGLDAAGVRAAIGLALADLDTQLAAIQLGIDDAQALALI